MNKLLLLAFAFFSSAALFAQDSNDPQNIKIVTTKEPSYPKGEEELYKYVLTHVKYSDEAKKQYVEGEVMLSFWVDTDSTVSNTKVVSGIGHGIDEEVKRVVEGLKFSPGMQNGKARKMNVIFTFPVKAH
jgi:TonB family protein